MTENTPKVSIVMPLYNAGEWLRPCLQSLIEQTLKEIEFIVVLDCPTDGSDRVAKEYAARDPRIRIIENEQNLGAGPTRNRGIEAARGEYVGFFDSDDYAEHDMYERLWDAARRHNADMVVCDFCRCYHHTAKVIPARYPVGEGVELRNKQLGNLFRRDNPRIGISSVWCWIFKRDFLVRHHLRFSDNRLLNAEDAVFMAQCLLSTERVAHCGAPAALYYNRQLDNTLSKQYVIRNTEANIYLVRAFDATLQQADAALRHAYRFDVAEGVVRILYTAFRWEVRVKGLRFALRQLPRMQDASVRRLVAPFLSWGGVVKAFRRLPITKWVFFYFFVCFLGRLRPAGSRSSG